MLRETNNSLPIVSMESERKWTLNLRKTEKMKPMQIIVISKRFHI